MYSFCDMREYWFRLGYKPRLDLTGDTSGKHQLECPLYTYRIQLDRYRVTPIIHIAICHYNYHHNIKMYHVPQNYD